MSSRDRGMTATTISAVFTGTAYLAGTATLARALWFSADDSSTNRADPVFIAAACCLVLCMIGLVAALVARARIGAADPIAPRVSRGVATTLLAASALGIAGALVLAFAGTVLSIGVG